MRNRRIYRDDIEVGGGWGRRGRGLPIVSQSGSRPDIAKSLHDLDRPETLGRVPLIDREAMIDGEIAILRTSPQNLALVLLQCFVSTTKAESRVFARLGIRLSLSVSTSKSGPHLNSEWKAA